MAAESKGCVRLVHTANNDTATSQRFADAEIAIEAHVTTDGLAN